MLQYALGFRELGHEVVMVDPCHRTDSAVAYFRRIERDEGLEGMVALVHPDRTATGIDFRELVRWASRADVLVNLAGVLRDDELKGPPAQRVYVDLDPAFTQLWQLSAGIDMGLTGHDRFATVGLQIGTGTLRIPTGGLEWHPTLPPVVLSAWPCARTAPERGITTVANWRSYGSLWHQGVHYGQKVHSVRAIVELPRLVAGICFEPALAIDPAETDDLRRLDTHGWHIVDPELETATPARYRRFVSSSTAEIGVAKAGYVMSQCGWFSDRSVAYLASGRPVVAQDTGWTNALPHDVGLLAYTGTADAAWAIGEVLGDYERHARGARILACDTFDSRTVLPRLLELPAASAPREADLNSAGARPRAVVV
jgi:hypothetical protein